jgi:hypothetical protein
MGAGSAEDYGLAQPVFSDDDVLDGLASASERLEDRIVVARWHAVPTSGAALRWEEFAAAVAAPDLHLAGDACDCKGSGSRAPIGWPIGPTVSGAG